MTPSKQEKIWYLYLIETKAGHLYTGISTDYKRRFEEHCENGPKTAKFLKGKGPLALKYCAELNNHSDALKAEIWLKKQTKQTKLSIIQGLHALPCEYPSIAIKTH